jgi:hypothetical protein
MCITDRDRDGEGRREGTMEGPEAAVVTSATAWSERKGRKEEGIRSEMEKGQGGSRVEEGGRGRQEEKGMGEGMRWPSDEEGDGRRKKNEVRPCFPPREFDAHCAWEGLI